MVGEITLCQIGVFLHVATLGRYNEVSDEVLLALKHSQLFTSISFIEVNIVGEGDFDVPFVDNRLKVIRRSPDVKAFEHLTLASIRHYCLGHPHSFVLYFNCLGGRHVGRWYRIRQRWRHLLYFLFIERFAACLEILRHYDVCGVEWSEHPLPHMTSNNWWATAKYISTLCSPSECIDLVQKTDLSRFGNAWREPELKRRHAGEFWIGMNPDAKSFSMLELKSLGLPTSDFGSVPWWGLPGIDWERVARRKIDGGAWEKADLIFLLQLIYFNVLFALRRVKRAVRSVGGFIKRRDASVA